MSNKNSQIDSSFENKKEFSEEDRIFILDFIDMFSAIKGKPLKLFFNPNSNQHYITFDQRKKEYQIYTDPYDKNIFWKTAIEHEICHFLFDTKFTSFKRHANKILENTPYELEINLYIQSIIFLKIKGSNHGSQNTN